MSVEISPDNVTNELKDYVSQLEKAVEELNSVREHLQENAHQVKCEIHSTVSRELEALRNREVWLLTQVDLLQNVKEDILRGQQAQINKELGRAEKGLKYIQTDKHAMTEDIRTGLERLDLTDLAPEESSHISFQADAAGLRDTIMEFGKVDGGNRIIRKVFADANTPSASLPKPFEDYDDAEHHVLYKTLEEVNRGNRASSNIIVNIPKLALKREQLMVASNPEKRPTKLNFPTLSNDLSDWLLPNTTSKATTHLTKDKSIQNWLHQIKHYPHTHDEEDDFEIVEHVTLSDASESVADAPTSVNTPIQGESSSIQTIDPVHFTQVTPETMADWLSQTAPPSSNVSTDQDPQMFTGLRHHSDDTEFWLQHKSSCSGSCSPCSDPMEIENLGSLLCVSKRGMFSHLPDDEEFWLKKRATPSTARVPPIENICKANEPCQCAEECVSSPSCHVEYIMSTQRENIWLLKDSRNTNSVDMQTELFSRTENYSDWLKKDQPSTPFSKNVFSSWFASVSDKPSDWLKTDQSVEMLHDIEQSSQPMETGSEEVICKPVSSDLEMWLLKRPLQKHTNLESILFPAFQNFQKALPQSAWLLGSSDNKLYTKSESDESEKKDTVSEKVELSKWLLKPSSLCSDKVTSLSGPGEWFFNKQLC